MLRRSTTLVPVARACCGLVNQPVPSQIRNIWDFARFPSPTAVVRNAFREMENMERDLYRNFPLGFPISKLVPIEGEDTRDQTYRVNVDVYGYRPENIKITVKDNIMKIEAKMDRTSQDGNRLHQSFVREFTIPDSVDQSTLKSFIHNDGILQIRAELFKKQNDPTAIPIQYETPKSKI